MHCAGLYLVATPIGNLLDITHRAVDCLKVVDYIACEDSRRTRTLLSAYGIEKTLIPLHAHNEKVTLSKMIKDMQSGARVALVSDAGTPLVQDPGRFLVLACHSMGVPVYVLPGPFAGISALVLSGYGQFATGEHFFFCGFLPKQKSRRLTLLKQRMALQVPLVIYEAPHRIQVLLQELQAIVSQDAKIFIAREMTKQWESYYQGTIVQILDQISSGELPCQGEFVLVILPQKTCTTKKNWDPELVKKLTPFLEKRPLSTKDLAKVLSELIGISRKEIYMHLKHCPKETT